MFLEITTLFSVAWLTLTPNRIKTYWLNAHALCFNIWKLVKTIEDYLRNNSEIVYWLRDYAIIFFGKSPFLPRNDPNKLQSSCETEHIWTLTSSFCYFHTFGFVALKTTRILPFDWVATIFAVQMPFWKRSVATTLPEAFWTQQFPSVKTPWPFPFRKRSMPSLVTKPFRMNDAISV